MTADDDEVMDIKKAVSKVMKAAEFLVHDEFPLRQYKPMFVQGLPSIITSKVLEAHAHDPWRGNPMALQLLECHVADSQKLSITYTGSPQQAIKLARAKSKGLSVDYEQFMKKFMGTYKQRIKGWSSASRRIFKISRDIARHIFAYMAVAKAQHNHMFFAVTVHVRLKAEFINGSGSKLLRYAPPAGRR